MKHTDISYFTRIIKWYLILTLAQSGITIDNDIHSEIDGAMENLTTAINTLVLANRALDARIEALETALSEALGDDNEISGAQFAAAQARWGRTQ